MPAERHQGPEGPPCRNPGLGRRAGFVRVGEETRAVGAGDAVLWPAGVEHTAWTEGEPLQAIVINLPPAG